MAIPSLCNEILLRIIEFSDLETISTLMKVTGFSRLLQTFETSIAKNNHRMSHLVAPNEGHSPFILVYDLSALEETQLSGRQDVPQAKPDLVRMNTFLGVEELQRRDNEVEILLRAPTLLIENPHEGKPHSWPVFPNTNSKSLLKDLLKRAMTRFDVLVDMEGRAMFEVAKPSLWYDYMPESEGATARDMCYSSTTTIPCNNQLVINTQLVPELTFKLQKEYLQNLPLDSLIELYFAGTYLAECRHQKLCAPEINVDYFKKDHSFQEATLRHGSWAIFNEFRGSGGRSKHDRQLRDQILERMVLRPHEDPTKDDVWHLDGLRTTLHRMLLCRLGGEDIRKMGGLRAEVYKRVGAMIEAPNAFEKPPSLEGRPDGIAKVNFEWL